MKITHISQSAIDSFNCSLSLFERKYLMLKKSIHVPSGTLDEIDAAGMVGMLEIQTTSVESEGDASIFCGRDIIATFPKCITPGGKFLHNRRAKLFARLLADEVHKEKESEE